jgi:hypothetical protein
MVDLSSIATGLSAVSSLAVIAGAAFIILQMRQNGRLIDATMHETKSQIAFALAEQIIDDSFVRRRKNMYDTVRKYGEKNWEGLLGSMEDFEARNYAYMFELFGQQIKDGVLDLKTTMDTLKYIVVFDWKAMEPMLRYLNQAHSIEGNPWSNFEWLAKETETHMKTNALRPP